ncbi:MAG: HEAT repeat domain-containing protein [Armatimonadetes bacterium]|nr:HEAT repeat domain-containing protein [Armatimonadota bacterium]
MGGLKDLLTRWKLNQLIAKLGSREQQEREEAVSGLAALGAAAVPAVLEQLRQGNSRARVGAALILRRLRPPQAVAALIERLGDAEEIVRDAARDALEDFGEDAVPALISRLKDPDELVRTGAAEALGLIKDLRALKPLLECAHAESLATREAAIDALGEIGHPAAVPALINLLNDPAPAIQQAALTALDKIGTPEALEAIKQWHEDHR